MQSAVVIPGTRLGMLSDSCVSGDGTYIRDGYVYASLLGTVVKEQDDQRVFLFDILIFDIQTVFHVSRAKSTISIPSVNSIVMGKVSKVTFQYANVDIMIVDGSSVKEAFSATIRKQDVRSFDRDSVDMSQCFVPGDIVRAEVISLGDTHAYYLTTAKNELGVVYAESIAGATLVPISWQEMECTLTGKKEPRKCAKPSTE